MVSASLSDLHAELESLNEPKFRAKQIYEWVRHKGVTDPKQMTNLPLALRHKLSQLPPTTNLTCVTERKSRDGTIKRAYELSDGQLIESVLMSYRDGRHTACISSQAGCAMGCVFCATGQMGFARQLTSNEIFEQAAQFDTELRARNRRLSNVVFMGMGEPLANFRNVMHAVDRINDELEIGARKITVSTVGLAPGIDKLARHPKQVSLAVSLHETTERARNALVPATARYGGLRKLMRSLRGYVESTNRRVSFEWALIRGHNDSTLKARELGNLLLEHRLPRSLVHVNVIPLNPTADFGGGASDDDSAKQFCDTLTREFRITATPRVRRGLDIGAGCGQLKAELTARTR